MIWLKDGRLVHIFIYLLLYNWNSRGFDGIRFSKRDEHKFWVYKHDIEESGSYLVKEGHSLCELPFETRDFEFSEIF